MEEMDRIWIVSASITHPVLTVMLLALLLAAAGWLLVTVVMILRHP